MSLFERDISKIEAAYVSEGRVLHDAAKAFLRRVGGQIIQYKTPHGSNDVLHFCADDEVKGIGVAGLQFQEKKLGLPIGSLCPIGGYMCGLNMLFMSPDGKVYTLSDVEFVELALSGEEAITKAIAWEQGLIIEEYK